MDWTAVQLSVAADLRFTVFVLKCSQIWQKCEKYNFTKYKSVSARFRSKYIDFAWLVPNIKKDVV